ncbi:MAG TPA: hypothetical protein PLU94_00740 [Methanoregulaceae archaeon]|nr:hypothetical protein [Methanoregulaceae archaeon]
MGVLVQQGFFKKQVNQVLDLIWLVDSGGIVRHKVAECRMVVVGAVSVTCPVPVLEKKMTGQRDPIPQMYGWYGPAQGGRCAGQL